MSYPQTIGRADSGLVTDLYSRQRTFFVCDEISPGLADTFIASLFWWAREDPKKPITVILDSVGGVVTSGLAMIDAIRTIRPPVHVLCTGWALSMGAIILSSGEKGHRYALPHAQIMIHQPSGGMRGMVSDQEIQAKENTRIKQVTAEILAENTGRTVKQISKDFDRDFFLTPAEAIKYGLIDGVLPPKSYPS